MMSPDGKYFWDGQKWVAVASASDAGHRSVFPSWNEIHVTVADQPVAPLPVRSDYARADGFFTYQVTPAMSKVWPALQLFNETCVNITSSCQNAAAAALAQVKGVELMIDHAQIPSCIATQVARVRGELTGMDAAITLAVKASADNNKAELSTAVSRYKTASKTLGADIAAISKAATARCDTQATGP